MTTAGKAEHQDLVEQEHCIDLPGESVQCWIGGGTDKLKVVLRKHRDIVFDIHLGNGKLYTLETTESDFYNSRDKKLVYAKRHEKITFKDGERFHVWVSRGFRGALILKSGEQIISEVKPNEWDKHRYTDDPKEKPAPIIVAINSCNSDPKPKSVDSHSKSSITHVEDQSVHIHEISKIGAPPFIINFFENGGESLHLDTDNIITRNWIIGQVIGVLGYGFDNKTWIRELSGCKFYLQRVVHKSGAKIYIIFSGNRRLREMISGTRYSSQHPIIVRISGGAGSVKQSWDAMKGAAKDSLKVVAKEEGKMVIKGGGIALFFTIAIDVAEWHKDYSEIGPDGTPKKDFYDLCSKVGTDLAKAGLVAALSTAAVSIGLSLLVAAGAIASAPVLAVVVGTIIVAAVVGYFVEKGDRAIGHALGEDDTTTWLAKKFREIGKYLSDSSKDFRYDYYAAIIL